jgi:hypothetical protein
MRKYKLSVGVFCEETGKYGFPRAYNEACLAREVVTRLDRVPRAHQLFLESKDNVGIQIAPTIDMLCLCISTGMSPAPIS